MREFNADFYKSKTLNEIIKNMSINNRNKLCTISFNGEQSINTYNELYELAKKYSGGLKEKNVNKVLLLCIDNPKSFIITLYACLISNIIAVPIEPLRINEIKEGNFSRLYNIVSQHKECAVITDDPNLPYYKKMAEVYEDNNLNCLCISDIANGMQYELSCSDENSCAIIQYSSGSTGNPKGVMLSHKNIITALSSLIVNFEVGQDTRMAIWAPLFHNMGLFITIASIMADFDSIIAHPGVFIQNPTLFMNLLVEKKIEITISNNFGLDWYVKGVDVSGLNEKSLDSLESLVVGSEVVSEETIERFYAKFKPFGLRENCIRPTYGMSEAGLGISASKPGEPLSIYDLNGIRLVGNGRALPNYEIKIIDKNGQIVGEGVQGEICIRSEAVTIGYLMNDDNDVFVDGWFKTGDMGIIVNGELYISGRQKDMIIVRGHNYMISDLEKELFGSLDLELSKLALCSRPGKNNEREELYMFIAAQKTDELEEKVDASANNLLKKFGFSIDYIVYVDDICRTSTGKTSRAGLLKNFDDGNVLSYRETKFTGVDEIQISANEGSDSIEQRICHIIAEIINIKETDIDFNTPYYEYVSNSVNQYKMMSAINESFNLELSPSFFRSHSTISEIAEELKEQVSVEEDEYSSASNGDIAITGIAFRLPGADNFDELWEMLETGRCMINDISPKRKELLNCPDWEGRISEIIDIDKFDAQFFDIPENEAPYIDPQQRLILETAYEALEDAAEAFINSSPKNIGTYITVGQQPYMMRICNYISENGIENVPANTLAGNLMNVSAARISHFFNFNGEAVAIDTACSSFLSALHMAKEAIRGGKIDGAVVSSAHFDLSKEEYLLSLKAGFLSKTGESRPFDKEANGAVMGEGVITVFIESIVSAIKKKKHIYAVIKGSAINNDGYSLSIMAPSLEGQKDVLKRAYKDANIDLADVSYVEAHGTGTTIGDPIEVHSLGKFFKRTHVNNNKIYIGSVKSNLGHLLSAASGAGLVKVLACFEKGKLVPSVGISEINPVLNLSKYPLDIADKLCDWNVPSGKKRTAGITSLGIGGTNVHMVLEQGTDYVSNTNSVFYPLIISAKTKEALDSKITQLKEFITHNPEKIADICYTSTAKRMLYKYAAYCIVDINNIERSFESIKYNNIQNKSNNPVYIVCGKKYENGEQFNGADSLINDFLADVENIKAIVVNNKLISAETYELSKEDVFTQICQIEETDKVIEFPKKTIRLGIDFSDAEVSCFEDQLKNRECFLDTICQLYIKGAAIKWDMIKEFGECHIVPIPGYPFNKKSYWI